MSKHASKTILSPARLCGRLYVVLRDEGFLPTSGDPAAPDSVYARFGVTPRRFWKAIRRLEQERSVRVAPEGVYFVPPEERW